eukprot:NODE_48_length_31852_cov_1.054168.p4 type:complete len:719 gc:universal NODE_48_length_31852_cov_1.054168:2450-4606(+)
MSINLIIYIIFGQIQDSLGRKFNSLQQAIESRAENLFFMSKIIGNCDTFINFPVNIVGNTHQLKCVDSGQVKSNNNLNISGLEIVNLKMELSGNGFLKIEDSNFIGKSSFSFDENSAAFINNVTIIDSSINLVAAKMTNLQISNIVEVNSQTLLISSDDSKIAIREWSRKFCTGNLFESKDSSFISIYGLTLENMSCTSNSGNTLIGTSRDTSNFDIKNLKATKIDASDCSIAFFSLTSNSAGALQDASIVDSVGRFLYMDDNSYLELNNCTIINLSESKNEYLIYMRGSSIMTIYKSKFDSTLGAILITEYSSLIVNSTQMLNMRGTESRKYVFSNFEFSKLQFNEVGVFYTQMVLNFDNFLISRGSSYTSFSNSIITGMDCTQVCLDIQSNSQLQISGSSFEALKFKTFTRLSGPYTRTLNISGNTYQSLDGDNFYDVSNSKIFSENEFINSAKVFAFFKISQNSQFFGLNLTSELVGTETSIGSVINSDKSFIELIRSNFTNNEALIGGVLFSVLSNLSLLNCEFISNKVNGDGGALYLDENTNFYSNLTNFKGNTASRGGAIYLNNTELPNSDFPFFNNSALQGNNIASSPKYFQMSLTRGRTINATIKITDLYKQPIVVQSWDPIILLSLKSETLKFFGQILIPVTSSEIKLNNIQVSGKLGQGEIQLIEVEDVVKFNGKILTTANIEIEPCQSDEIEITNNEMYECVKSFLC